MKIWVVTQECRYIEVFTNLQAAMGSVELTYSCTKKPRVVTHNTTKVVYDNGIEITETEPQDFIDHL